MARRQQPSDPDAELARLWEMVARTQQMYRHAAKRDRQSLMRLELRVMDRLAKLVERGGKPRSR
jgi:hypothetical protein